MRILVSSCNVTGCPTTIESQADQLWSGKLLKAITPESRPKLKYCPNGASSGNINSAGDTVQVELNGCRNCP
ncbi:hypothetical protein Q8G50_32520, partial [Klebsiella pneumoniae]